MKEMSVYDMVETIRDAVNNAEMDDAQAARLARRMVREALLANLRSLYGENDGQSAIDYGLALDDDSEAPF